ncbi:MAG: CoA pyrophosphatase [Bacteroidia bacterium]|nr:CoA pyrophosphatase [Bacteroidia bacterium]
MMFTSFISSLKEQLSGPLPGFDAQFQMAPEGRKKLPYNISTIKGYRESAVCLFLFERNGKIYFPLIERPVYDGVHSGQLALPGGKTEKEDEDFIAGALREMMEEIGAEITRKNVIGKLTDIYIPPSNFMVKPVVAFSESIPVYNINPKEVESVIEFGLHELMNDELIKETELTVYNNAKIKTPYFEVRGKILWGATAMMLNEFKTILKSENLLSLI